MAYMDCLVMPVKTAAKEAFLALSKKSNDLCKRHGALSATDCWGNDVPEGKLTSFPMAVKLEPDETVVVSWITWPSRAVRDAAQAAMSPEMYEIFKDATFFDGARMIFGGFEPLPE